MTTLAAVDGPRACRPDEVTGMIALANSVMRQGSAQSFLTDYPLVYTSGNLPNVQIMKADDTVVSVVPFIPKQIAYADTRFRIGIISPTATHPEHRRLGYAGRCLDACIAGMEAAGIELSVLWTLPTTFPFYEMAGFQAVPSQMDWAHCTRDDAAAFQPGGHTVVTLDADDRNQLNAIAYLHAASPCGVIRSEHDTQALFSLPRTTTYLACDEAGKICAYLLHCDGTHKPGILEAEGTPDAVESLAYHALIASEAPKTTVYLTKSASALSMLFQQRLAARVQLMEAGPMMIRINNPDRFLKAISPWLAAQSRDERYSFSLEIKETRQVIGFDHDPARSEPFKLTSDRVADHHVITRRELTSLIFGSREENTSELASLLNLRNPFFFPIPMLDHS
jgi:predicted acetyltransferase